MSFDKARPLHKICAAGVAGRALRRRFGSAPAAAAEKITYLLPAPPSLPAFAPWVLAKHLGYYTEAGYDVDFVVARGGVDVAKQIGVGNAPIGGAIGDTPIIVRGNGVPVKAVGADGRRRAHRRGRPQGPRHREDRGPARQEDFRARLPGHHLLRAARRARLQGHHQERRECAGGRSGRGGKPGGRRHRRCLRLHAGLGDQRQGRRDGRGVASHQGLFPVDVAGDPGLRQDDRGAAGHGARASSRRRCAA